MTRLEKINLLINRCKLQMEIAMLVYDFDLFDRYFAIGHRLLDIKERMLRV